MSTEVTDLSKKSLKELNAEAKRLCLSAKAVFDKGDEASPSELEQAQKDGETAQQISDMLARSGKADPLKIANRIDNTLSLLYQEKPHELPSGDGNKPTVDLSTIKGWDGGSDFPAIWQMKEPSRLLTGHDGYKGWLQGLAPNGQVPEAIGRSPAFLLEPRLIASQLEKQGYDAKSLLTYSTTSGGAMVWSERRPDIIGPAPFRPFLILDLLTRVPVTSTSVDFVRITSFTNNAAPTAPSTTTSSGPLKPESAIVYEQVNAPVRIIPHWIPVINQMLSDAPALRAQIDDFLRDGITEEVEDQCIAGDGQGQNFTGVINTTGVLSQTFDTDLIKTVRKARTLIRTQGKRVIPNAVGMSPSTWEAVDLMQDGEQRYYFGGPFIMGLPRMWGLAVIESEAFPDATGVVGNWKEALLFDRESITIRISESHSDFFVRNISVVLAEARYGFGIRYPKAFCKFATS